MSLPGVETAARDVDSAAAANFQCIGEFDGLFDVPAIVNPIGARDADGHGAFRGEDVAHGIENFEREPHAVFQRAAVVVGAPIA